MVNSKFLKVRCTRCNHCQIIFGKASTLVKCKGCKTMLIKRTGGKARIMAEVADIL